MADEENGGAVSTLPQRNLTLLRVVAMLMAGTSAGPYGFEECIGSGGAALTLLGLLVVPFIWSAPIALVTGELSTAIAENGGHIIWIDRALGSFWSFQNSFWTFFCNTFECAVYPAMFVDYLGLALFQKEFAPHERFMLCLTAVLMFLVVNIRGGAGGVGDISVAISVIGLMPFLAMIVFGAPSIHTDHLTRALPLDKVDWRNFVTILLWNTSGYDFIGAISGEVKDPTRTIPRALAVSCLGTIVVDTLAVAVGVSVATDHEEWADGHFVLVGLKVGGKALQSAFLVGAAISTLGLLCSMLCTTSWFLCAMAKVGTVPSIFAKLHPKYETPWIALTANATIISLSVMLDFSEIAELEMFLYCASTVLKFGAFYVLRLKEKNMDRPFKVPLQSNVAVAIFVTIPISLCLGLMVLARKRTQLIGVAVSALAVIAYLSVPARNRKLPVAVELID